MKNGTFFLIAALCATAVSAQDQEDIRFKPISIAGQFDNGQVIKGSLSQWEKLQPGTKLDGNFFQRTGVWITQEATVRERLRITVGVGGIFWYSLPSNEGDPSSHLTQFGPGISQAQGVYTWGDLENPAASLQMGFFPYKYNPDAKNLGEYLLRSGTYPGYLVSGGWNMISSAAYMVQGARLNVPLWGGKANVDFLLPMEHDMPPMYSMSPTLVANVRPVDGVYLGAGVAWNHGLSFKPSYEDPSAGGFNRIITGDSLVLDPVAGTYNYHRTYHATDRYTYQGFKAMAHASVDPKAFIPMPALGPEDLKVYGEVALLGVQNYGYMYEKPLERMPVMFGLNLPAFNWLDVLSFEMEYYNSPYLNNVLNPMYNQTPMAFLPPESGSLEDYYAYKKAAERDNWKWTVYAKKQVVKGIEIYAQAASDHIRTFQVNGGPEPVLSPITNKNGKEWYYLIRLQFGI